MDNPAASGLCSLIPRHHFGVTTEDAQFVRVRFKTVKSDAFEARPGGPHHHVNIAAIAHLYYLDQRRPLLHLHFRIFQASVQHAQRAVFPEAQKNSRPEQYFRPPGAGAQHLPLLELREFEGRHIEGLSIDRHLTSDVMNGPGPRADHVLRPGGVRGQKEKREFA